MPDSFLGTAQGEVQPAVGSVPLAELLCDQLVVCLAGAVCKHHCTMMIDLVLSAFTIFDRT